jgi:uncharacterized protein YjbI with pentapeptide repeats
MQKITFDQDQQLRDYENFKKRDIKKILIEYTTLCYDIINIIKHYSVPIAKIEPYAQLPGINLVGYDFTLDFWKKRYSESAPIVFIYIDLTYINLSNADLRHSNITNLNLKFSDLSYSDLRDAYINDSYISSTNFEYSDIRRLCIKYTILLPNVRFDYAKTDNIHMSNKYPATIYCE